MVSFHARQGLQGDMFLLSYHVPIDTVIVETACDELSNSIRLRKLLGIVLNVGNRLNTAGVSSKQKAGAFKLESLLKLSHAKAFDKKTTFLHYIVLVVQRNNELLLRFKDDLPTVLKADKVYWDQCVSDLEEVENQLENVRKIALHQARLALAYRIKKSHNVNESGESLSDCSMSLEEEVELLRATPIGVFTLAAIKKVSTLRDKVETTKAKFTKLLEYFGEEEKQDMQPHELFNIMVTFCKDFEKAKEQVYDSTKKKMREDRKLQASNKGIPPSPTPSSKPQSLVVSGSPVRLSNLQPNMSSILKPYASEVRQNRETQYEPLTPRSHRQSASRFILSPTPLTSSRRESTQAPGQETLDSSVDDFSDGDSFRCSPSTSSTAVSDPNSSMRQKARIRRLRVSGRSSVSSSTSVTSSTTGTSFGSIVRPDLTTQPQQLSPRSSIRHRRRTEQRVGRGQD
jgi:Formin Homology 2 Domain